MGIGGLLGQRRGAPGVSRPGDVLDAAARPAAGTWASRPALAAASVTLVRVLAGVVLAVLTVKLARLGPALTVGSPHSTTGGLLHWDAAWYRDIVRSGYAGVPKRTSFFPVYPLLVRLLTGIGLPYAFAALGLSWVAFFFATWSVIELTNLLFPGARSVRAALLFAWFPMSVFLLSGYAEPLYAALAGWSFVMVARRRYVAAVALAAVASATRPEGLFVGTAVVVALLLARRYRHAALAGLGSLAGLAGFSAYCWLTFGSPIEYVRVQAYWFRQTTVPFLLVLRNLHLFLAGVRGDSDYQAEVLVQDLVLVAGAVGVVLLARLARGRAHLVPFLPFCVLTVLLAASNGTRGTYPDGAGRMMLGLVPLFAGATQAGGRRWRVLVGCSAVLAVMVEVLFNAGRAIV